MRKIGLVFSLICAAVESTAVAQGSYEDCFRLAQQRVTENAASCDKQFPGNADLHFHCVDIGQQRFKIEATECASKRDEARRQQGLDPIVVPIVRAKDGSAPAGQQPTGASGKCGTRQDGLSPELPNGQCRGVQ